MKTKAQAEAEVNCALAQLWDALVAWDADETQVRTKLSPYGLTTVPAGTFLRTSFEEARAADRVRPLSHHITDPDSLETGAA